MTLERETELAGLRAALAAACGGAGRFVLIEGVAGIGKTRLLGEARALAEAQGLRVLRARATEFERGFPFGIVRQLLEPVLLAASADERAALLTDGARAAEPVFAGGPTETDAPDIIDPAFARLNGLFWLLANLAESAPVALLVDDVQWADQASQRFLRFLQPRLDGLPVVIVAAGRPDDALSELEADPVSEVLHPAPLSTEAVAALVRSGLAPAAEDAFCDACHAACGGNPFLLSELLVELRGARGLAAESARVGRVAPRSVQRAVVARVAGLGAGARAVALAVAVLGDDAALAHVAALAALDAGAAGREADALAGEGVLEPARPLRFVHPLVRNAVYADIGHVEAAAAHERAASLLAAQGADPERVALHLLEAEPGDDTAAVTLLVAAARRALAKGVPDTAIRYLRRALAQRVDGEPRRDALWLLVVAATHAMDHDAFDGLAADPLDELGAEPDLDQRRTLGVWLHLCGRAEEALRLMDESMVIAERAGDVRALLSLEAQRVVIAQQAPREPERRLEAYAARVEPGTPAERLLLAQRAHWASLAGESAARTADFAQRALVDGLVFAENPNSAPPTQAVVALMLCEDLDTPERISEQWLDRVRRRGWSFETAAASLLLGRIAHVRGEVALAEARIRGAFEQFASVAQRMAFTSAWLIETLIERADLDAAEAQLQAAGLDGPLPDAYWGIRARFARGQLRMAQGRGPEATEDLFAVGAYMDAADQRNPAWMPWGSAIAPALADDWARAVVLDELARARRWGSPAPIGRALRALAALDEPRLELLEESLAVLGASPLRLERLRTLCDLGTALRHARRNVEARTPLRRALGEARLLGATAIARRAHEELAATGESVRPFTATGAQALTPSELRVATMAATGMSNRDIAQSLFLTVKTVETHLSAAYRKLDVRGRSQLSHALAV